MKEFLKSALFFFLLNKKQSLLSAAGIAIGIFTSVVVINIGQSSQKKLQNAMETFGENMVVVSATIPTNNPHRRKVAHTLTVNDAISIKNRLKNAIRDMALVCSLHRMDVKNSNNSMYVDLSGVTPNFFAMRNFHIVNGRLFGQIDENAAKNVAVVGYAVKKNLLKNGIFRTITIKNIPFRVIGVLKPMGVDLTNTNLDESVYIPLTTAMKKIYNVHYITNIFIQTRYDINKQIDALLVRNHKIINLRDKDFTIDTEKELYDTKDETMKIMRLVTFLIASISLIIGGIGIMGMMFVTVEKRRAEIAIRRSYGATKLNIIYQFLVESLFICIFGGIIGLILAEAVSLSILFFLHWPLVFNILPIVLSFGIVFCSGLIFGYIPARKAANTTIVEIIR